MKNNNQALDLQVMDKNLINSALRRSFGDVVYLIHNIDDIKYRNPIEEGKWSPEEILGHLWLSTTPVSKALTIPKEKLAEKFGMLEREELDFEELKSKYYAALEKGVKAPPPFVFSQKGELDKNEMIQEFTKSLDSLLSTLDQWTEDELSKYVLLHPAIGALSMREMLYFTHLHTIHHYRQMIDLK